MAAAPSALPGSHKESDPMPQPQTTVQPPERVSVSFNVAEPVADMLDQLLASGLYGDTLDECIDRLVCQELVRLIGAGFIHVDRPAPDEPKLPRELGERGAAATARDGGR